MKTIRYLIMGIALGIAITASAVPPRLHYQGRLLDPLGNPISANVTMAIDLYAAATGGSPLYSEAVGAVAVINGIYSFEFGQNPEALAAALEVDDVWLEVRVNGEALMPRQRLNASPYAIRSGRVDVETDPQWSAVSNAVSGDAALGAAAHGWGDHGAAGYVPVSGATMTGALALPAGGLSVGASQFVVLANGNVGIGLANPTNTFAVNGDIRAREIVVTLDGWPDYVFASDYKLRPLDEVQAFIALHGHLPDIPSANEIAQGGVNLGASQAHLLRKVEELTLYLIQLKQENAELKNDLNTLGRSVEALQTPR